MTDPSRLHAGAVAAVALALGLGGAVSGRARHDQAATDALRPIVATPVGFGVSPAVADLAPLPDARESAALAPGIAAPTVSAAGISSADNFAVYGERRAPPDANGDVGPNHYVQTVNYLVQVFNKAGAPLTAPFRLSSLFAAMGDICGTFDDGDPIVLYDPLADRWLLSQRGITGGPPFHQCTAVSKTPDPTGQYFVYAFVTPGYFADDPKFGVWPDAYYMSGVQVTSGLVYDGAGVFAFDRAKMIAGDSTAAMIYFNKNLASDPDPRGLGGILPSDFDGLTAPPLGRPNTFAHLTATEFGNPADGLRLFDFHADFAAPANSTFTERPESAYAAPVAVAAFDPTNPLSLDDIQQPGGSGVNALDAVGDRLMFRLQYRNTGAVESLVVSHTVGAPASTTLGAYRAGVRYYQLTRNVAGGGYSVAEQATYAPADGVSRWVPSAATDHQGNLAVGFSASSTAVFPSIRYAGRLATDPAGGLFQGENTLVAGTGIQTSPESRWGNYSALTVDPVDDCTFWFTSEYYTAASQATSPLGWLTRFGSFKFPECTAAPRGTLQGVVTNANTSAGIVGVTIQISNGFSQTSLGAGAYARSLAPGTYRVMFSAVGYASVAVSDVVITNGGTTVLNQALVPIADIAAAGGSLVAESVPNGRLDPGEMVTVSLCLSNTGTVASGVITGTLHATGGVQSPSGAQPYGTVAAGGNACRTFSLIVGTPCGGTMTATLQAQELGGLTRQLSYAFLVGGQLPIFSEGFDGVTAPALPAGWTTTTTGVNSWVTSTTSPDSNPNRAVASVPATVTDSRLISPLIGLPASGSVLTFQNHFDMLEGFDGGVLEISINGGAFTDIIAAGGSFVTGGYNGTISGLFGSPIQGRQAWTGDSGGYVTTTVNLPPAANGLNVRVRWRLGTDNFGPGMGWAVDTIAILTAFGCTGVAPVITTHPRSQTAMLGATATLSVTAAGASPLAYQWYLGNSPDTASPIGGATLSSYTTPPLGAPAAYWVRVSNGSGSANSNTANLAMGPAAGAEMVTNGNFSAGTASWSLFEVPDIIFSVVGGVFQWFRANPTTTASGQAVVFQETFRPVAAGTPLRATFDIANSSTARKRVSVLIIDSNFSDITVCTFWLAPGAPMRTYTMRTHTTKDWANAAIYFYAATKGADGGNYHLDNVSLSYQPAVSATRTDCGDPTAPGPTGGGAGPNLVSNGDFDSGALGAWSTFGSLTSQIAGGVFEFYRNAPLPTPAGVVLQTTGQTTVANEIVTATFQLGNTSAVRKRVTVLLHDQSFGDLMACTFWLPPGQPLLTYTMQGYSTVAWSNATLSVYGATVGSDTWIRLDNVMFARTPATAILGTECIEPVVPPLAGIGGGR